MNILDEIVIMSTMGYSIINIILIAKMYNDHIYRCDGTCSINIYRLSCKIKILGNIKDWSGILRKFIILRLFLMKREN